MMQRILKGDTSGQIALALADGYNYAGCVVEFRYQGAVRTFRNCEEGQTIQFNFTAAETAVMALGAFPVTVRLFTPDGRFYTVNNADVKIEVTDCIADVREGGVIVVEASSGLYGVDDLPERYTTKDIREKINEIIQRLGGGVAALCLTACVACGSLFGAGVTVQKANLEDIHNDEKVVTSVTFDASGLATTADVEQAMRKKDGAARMLPQYLHALLFADVYTDDAEWYFALADMGGACSSVRDGNAYSRNFDFPYDERAEFIVQMTAGPDRFASVGVSNVGTNLTEAIVTSGKPSRFYKALPGATVDGINERGVAANINVVPANGAERTVWAGHEINAIGAVRWVLDHAPSAGWAASNLAAKVYIPDALIRKGYSAHFMVADERETWIVEDGIARKADGLAVLTNFRIYAQDDPFGTGYERHALLASGGNITSAWFRAAYRRPFTRPTEFAAPGVGTHTETDALAAWADANVPQGAPESLTRNGKSWQTVHCSVYDISNRVLRVAVQETPDWYVFGIPASGRVLSVNGKAGSVQLTAADVGAFGPGDLYDGYGTPVVGKPVEANWAWRTINAKQNQGSALTVGSTPNRYGAVTYDIDGQDPFAPNVRAKISIAAGTATSEMSGTAYITPRNTMGNGELAYLSEVNSAVDGLTDGETVTNIVRSMTNETALIKSVNGMTGDVNLSAADVNAVPWITDSEGHATAITVGTRSGSVGRQSVTVGNGVTASGQRTFASGSGTKASGNDSHAEGENTVASGNQSHAEGYNSTASQDEAHAEGFWTTASGKYSHAEGMSTIASGDSSHAEGRNTFAAGEASHAGGHRANTLDGSKYGFSHGNRTVAATGAIALGYQAVSARTGDFTNPDGIVTNVTDKHKYSFVWQGKADDDNIGYYHSHGDGTFNIKPIGGTEGFWIGSENLATIIANNAMKDNAVVWTNNTVKTKDGTKVITAADFGALQITNVNGAVSKTVEWDGDVLKMKAKIYPLDSTFNPWVKLDFRTKSFALDGSSSNGAFSFSQGKECEANAEYSASFGHKTKVSGNDRYAFAWNGDGNVSNYASHGPGTFNINPMDGTDGFWIGSQNLSGILSGYANLSDLAEVSGNVDQSLAYAQGVYNFMNGNTNVWFSGTNYVTTADGTTRTRFVWEDGMDADTVPCSMSLWEIRDGKKVVWDQRDWTVWYWNFKSAQMSADIQGRIDAVSDEVGTNCMKRGWAKYTAVRGLDNPDPSTLWIDTPKVQLMAGHQWEKIVEVGGAGYWTITGNGIELSPQDAESTFLTIKDFEGNACLTFRKTSSYLVYCECGTDIVSNNQDGQGRVVFHLTTDVQPTAEFSTVLDSDSFVEQGEDGCPANYEWTGSAGNWDCHFKLKPGITANACFARFKVMHEGENVVEHTVPIKINGGIVFEQNGQTLKCKPVAQGTSVGSTVNWVITQ